MAKSSAFIINYFSLFFCFCVVNNVRVPVKKVHESSLPRIGSGRVCLDFVICTSHGPYEELRGVVNDTFVLHAKDQRFKSENQRVATPTPIPRLDNWEGCIRKGIRCITCGKHANPSAAKGSLHNIDGTK